MGTSRESVQVFEADPGLGEGLSGGQLAAARQAVVASVQRLRTGLWQVVDEQVPTGGFLVLEGCITRVTPRPASQSASPSSAAVIVVTVRTSCMRCPRGPGTRAQHTTSALPISSAATRSTISGSPVSTCITIASSVLTGGGHP
jgi:hypothetical protein